MPIGQPWAGLTTWNPFDMFGKEGHAAGQWAGWVYAADADTGVWRWRPRSNHPIVGAVAFFGDLGGNYYPLDAAVIAICAAVVCWLFRGKLRKGYG